MSDIAVLDVETTGINPYRGHRVVEVAIVAIGVDGKVLREFVTLVNPGRDVGPTRIHGLSSRDLLNAPRFNEIAGALVEALDGCAALAGHNVRFDRSFLSAEFGRLGHAFPSAPMLCTMHLAGGGSLSRACADYGVKIEGEPHSALYDAHNTARLLAILLKDAPHLTDQIISSSPIAWPIIAKSSAKALTRSDSRKFQTQPPTYLEKLLARVQPNLPADSQDSAVVEYTALIDRALEDRQVDQEEARTLADFATRWSLSPSAILSIHRDYLLRLTTVALQGRVTDFERRELLDVAALLGISQRDLDEVMETASAKHAELQTRPSGIGELTDAEITGKTVCFTGECQCRFQGQAISREMAAKIAIDNGMTVAESVTKSLDILVVADPMTLSGKANKARKYRIRIMHEPVFWRAIGLEVE